jgi:Domain of unknown function (DUF4349)
MRGSRTTAASIAGLLGAAVLLMGCSSGDADSTSSAGGDSLRSTGAAPAPESLEDAVAQDRAGGGARDGGTSGGGTLAGVTVERSVIAVADLTLRTEDVSAAVSVVQSVAVSLGGYVSGQDVSSSPDDPERSRATVVVRVPTTKLETAIDRMQEAGELVRVTSDARDVTEQVVDVDSRVESARASVERIRALLSEARTLGEVVRVESELAQREADLEALLATQRALADQTAMATLSVTLLAPAAVEPPPADEDGFVPGLQRGWDALVDVVVVALTVLGVLLPFLVVGALVLGPIAAAWRHRRQRAESVAPQPPAEERDRAPVG